MNFPENVNNDILGTDDKILVVIRITVLVGSRSFFKGFLIITLIRNIGGVMHWLRYALSECFVFTFFILFFNKELEKVMLS